MPLGWKATDVPGTFSRIMPARDRIKTEWTDSSKETLTTLDPLRRESTGNTTLSCKFRVILDPSRINLKPRIFGTLTRNVFRSIEEEKGTSRKGKGAIKISITSRLLPSSWRSIALLSPLRLRRVSIKSNEILGWAVGRARPCYCGEHGSFRTTPRNLFKCGFRSSSSLRTPLFTRFFSHNRERRKNIFRALFRISSLTFLSYALHESSIGQLNSWRNFRDFIFSSEFLAAFHTLNWIDAVPLLLPAKVCDELFNSF